MANKASFWLRVGSSSILMLSLPSLAIGSASNDADEAAVEADTARKVAQKANEEAETALIIAQTALNKARIDSLGLPSFSGVTEVGQSGGAMEANILSAAALNEAASDIAEAVKGIGLAATDGSSKEVPFLLLAGEESLDFGVAGRIRTQMAAIYQLFAAAKLDIQSVGPASSTADMGMIVSAISAASGLLRSETTITPLESNAITDRMLVVALAGKFTRTIIIPSAPMYIVDSDGSTGAWKNRRILEQFNALTQLRGFAQARREELGEKPDAKEKPEAAALDAAINRYDAFVAKATVPDNNGNVPLSQAASLESFANAKPYILRVKVEKAGGSLVNTKNIATTFGVDPLKVSGGVIVSYLVTDPSNAHVKKAGILVCRTTLARLRKVQAWNRQKTSSAGSIAKCQPTF